MAGIFLIIDGLPDNQINNIELAKTGQYFPSFTQLSKDMQKGFFNTRAKGFTTDSLSCISTLMGCKPCEIPKGRAFLEAEFTGVNVGDEDLIFRTNIVSFKDGRLDSFSYGDDNFRHKAYKILQDNLDITGIKLHHIKSYKGILTLKNGGDLINKITTYPPHENLGISYNQLLEKEDLPSKVLTQSNKILKEAGLGDNLALIIWGESIKSPMPSFKSLHSREVSVITGAEIVKGITVAMGGKVITGAWATGNIDTQLMEKYHQLVKAINEDEIVVLHLNGADEAAHSRDFNSKLDYLTRVDKEIIAPLIKELSPEDKLLICSDHGTDSQQGNHLLGVQPFWLYGGDKIIENKVYSGRKAISFIL